MLNSQAIMDFEAMLLNEAQVEALFTSLINTGDIWKLPTIYLNTAAYLYELGVIGKDKGTLQ